MTARRTSIVSGTSATPGGASGTSSAASSTPQFLGWRRPLTALWRGRRPCSRPSSCCPARSPRRRPPKSSRPLPAQNMWVTIATRGVIAIASTFASCCPTSVPHLRLQTIRPASSSLPATAGARPQGERRIRRPALTLTSPRGPSRWPNGWRKMARTSPSSQEQFDSTKLSRRRFCRGSCRSNSL